MLLSFLQMPFGSVMQLKYACLHYYGLEPDQPLLGPQASVASTGGSRILSGLQGPIATFHRLFRRCLHALTLNGAGFSCVSFFLLLRRSIPVFPCSLRSAFVLP